MNTTMQQENQYGAEIYHPLPLVLTRGEGIHVWDDQGKCYIDMMSAYSAVSHGHAHPRLVAALVKQAQTLAITSRAYYSDKLGPFLKTLCETTGYDQAIPMNTGAEAVETAIKAARKWAYTVKGVAKDKAEIIACSGNFHGRTITIVGMSSEQQYRDNFGPFPEGFKLVDYGDAAALENAITKNTAAFLVEPIQGEGGIKMPPQDYLKACKEICEKHNVLFIADEIQCGLGRTGKLLACEHEDVHPDGLILGKALGGGLLAVSAFLADSAVMDVFSAGDHGSTFGGNPLSSVVANEGLKVLLEEKLVENSAKLGQYFIEGLRKINNPAITEVRGKGLFIGLELDPKLLKARDVCMQLMDKGLLSKETHETVIRFAPPLVITKTQIDEALAIIRSVLES
jgi:ornithine--oxo-acid transaminase